MEKHKCYLDENNKINKEAVIKALTKAVEDNQVIMANQLFSDLCLLEIIDELSEIKKALSFSNFLKKGF